MTPVIEGEGLRVRLPTSNGEVTVVDGVDYVVEPGEMFGVAGESGSGKSMSVLALMQLLPQGAHVEGRAVYAGRDLLTLRPRALRDVRGTELAMVFQDPLTSLHPMLTIGKQISEHVRFHEGLGRRAAERRAVELLDEVRIPDPEQALQSHAHQFSGGMRQRIAIAIALACHPKLLIADEPTTALDVTVQAGIIGLLDRLRHDSGVSIILITHDLGVMSSIADEVAVMYAGRVVERASTPALFKSMHMPYTQALLAAIPKIDAAPHTPLPAISGRPPDPTRPIQGCSFSPRCRYAAGRCFREKPLLAAAESPDHQYACFHPIGIATGVHA